MAETPEGLRDAPATGRNGEVILEVLRQYLGDGTRSEPLSIIEVGSGTGQHAVHFAAALPHVTWQATDVAENLPDIDAWLRSRALSNTPPARELDASRSEAWPEARFDAVFSANTLHIMPWSTVQSLFRGLPRLLAPAALLIVYGPFNRDGQFTSESNAQFDLWLKARDPLCGIRDFEAVDALARKANLELVEDRAMPANNRCVVWRKRAE